MRFRFTFLLLCIVSLVWNYHSLDSLARVKQSNQQGLKHCRAFDKGFSLHRSIMPTSGESEEVNEEERILELKREKRQKDCSYQNAPQFRKTECEWRRFRVD